MKPEKQGPVRALRAPEDLCCVFLPALCPMTLFWPSPELSAPVPEMLQQCQTTSPSPSLYIVGLLRCTPSPCNVHCIFSPALSLVPASFVPDGATWIDSGPGSLFGTSGTAIDRHGRRVSQIYNHQSSFLKINVTLDIFYDCPRVYMLSGNLGSIFWSHKVVKY